ncbi:lipoprotein-releasing system ATP-binding protein LolD [Amylibacter marinus]|uniref:Lipoprotein-releasing system ATP-binding protein LolD n=1 Tax=Amylibacter marinus TaxID=1475483 RepID=A0ABQ5VUF5_9RHOB|nr:ABC transporter ATP-binding protein [Amylibacter marinus]GLQ34959.1 lipoprotein-releasing system ATP-binding protein LolD [Amylibacter marinus]
MNEILRLETISKAYTSGAGRRVQVLDAADLCVNAGEIVGLVAPSGAGKSTLLHIAGLLDNADSGRVYISGVDTSQQSDRRRTATRRNDIGFVYQFHHLLPEFSALENLMLPQMANGRSKATAEARATELLASVGLEARGHHRPAEMSGGEQQRVAFCRAMANAPKLLIADEPTGNLDPETAERVFVTLVKLVRETGLAAVIATHNHELAARMDRQLSLSGGKLIPL